MAETVKKDVKETKEVVAPKKEEAAPKKERKPRKPREKVRSVEEIYDMSVNKLTDKEKNALIKHLREKILFVENQVCQYKQSAEGAFARARDNENKYDAMENYYLEGFKEINIQLAAFSKAVNRVTGGIK